MVVNLMLIALSIINALFQRGGAFNALLDSISLLSNEFQFGNIR